MPDEVREHPTRDQRIPSFRITPYPSDSQLHDGASSLQFTSLIFFRVPVRGLECHSRSLVLYSVTLFVLFLRFVFGLLYDWKIQTWKDPNTVPFEVTVVSDN